MKVFVAAWEALKSDGDEHTHLNFQRAYRLTPVPCEADDYIARVRVGAAVIRASCCRTQSDSAEIAR